jgi:hypothetical protein
MIHIQKASIQDANILTEVGFQSFKSAHGHSAPKKDIEEYMALNFNETSFTKALSEEIKQLANGKTTPFLAAKRLLGEES